MKRNTDALHLDINSMWRKLFPLDITAEFSWCTMEWPSKACSTKECSSSSSRPRGSKTAQSPWTNCHSFILLGGNRFYTDRAHIPEQNGLVFATLHSHLKGVLHRWFTLQTETDFKKIGTSWWQSGSPRKKASE